MNKSEKALYSCFAVVFTVASFYHYGSVLITGLDELFRTVTGKKLLTRALPIQIVIFAFLGLCTIFLLFFLFRVLNDHPAFAAVFCGILILLVLTMLADLCANQIIRRDDLWEIREAEKYGFSGVMRYDFINYNGRYFSWFLKAFYSITKPLVYIRIMLWLNFVLNYSGLYALIVQLLNRLRSGDPLNRITAAGLSLSTLIGFILISSNIWEVWFWASAAFVYGTGVGLVIWTFALLLYSQNKPFSESAALRILPFVTAFLACGCSELVCASLWILLLALTVFCRIRNHRRSPLFTSVFLFVSLCSLGIVLFSGTANLAKQRAGYEPKPFRESLSIIFRNLPDSFRYIFRSLWGFILIRWKHLVNFLSIAFCIGSAYPVKTDQKKGALLAAAALLITAHLSLSVNTLANFMPPRVISVPICWVILSGGILSFIAGGSLFERIAPSPNSLCSTICLAASFFCMLDFYSENIRFIRNVNISWTQQDAELSAIEDKDSIILTCGIPIPGSATRDPAEDVNNSYNINIAEYYGLKGVYAEDRCPLFR